ncbi:MULTISPECIES: M48 family metallopeptidase [Rhizobium]|uniref:M48 family metallopeptidase n=1 Tax=Rhizobium TaxID=379 RepID=UPI0010318C05|nr:MULTISPECIES: SprT family zinc-dependent metalloprotease [Rhizobium]MBY3492562.1 M48 family metallopeptidase [Rhizobium laguerreae]TBE57172.1 M48 family peptidase [Rhizobium leguminosarum]TBY90211.1 M48 family peptidase [Rhizobium leguminosarum bv. viciae]
MGHFERLLHYGGEVIPYTVKVTTGRRERVRIHVHHDGTVEVEAPEEATAEEIGKAVQKRARWVHDHVHDAKRRFEHVLPREYVSGEQVFYLGRRYSLKVRHVPHQERSVKLKGALLEVAHDHVSADAVRARVRAWYRVKARDYFAYRLGVIAKGLPWPQELPNFQLKEMRTRWGSCAAGGMVTLNPFLVRANRECIDYVITHELCHLREHNHSPEFFRLLSHAMPQWETIKRSLDDMAEVLLND